MTYFIPSGPCLKLFEEDWSGNISAPFEWLLRLIYTAPFASVSNCMSDAFSIIDSHCHLDRFFHKEELDRTIGDAREAGVDRLVTIGTSDEDWQLYQDLSSQHPGIIDYTVGLHPCNVDENWEQQIQQLKAFFQKDGPRPVALGEIGLDHFHLPKNDEEKAGELKAFQVAAFRVQLKIANELDCPVVIHSRGAFDDCMEELDAAEINWSKVVFHCFVENVRAIRILNERGGRGSFTGIITFKNAEDVREAALAQGIEKLMVETDAPYLAPIPHRGKLCLPSYTALTAKYCAKLFNVSEVDLANITRNNTEAFYGLE
ncbi:MAG: TatD family hydrolase [Verrucomicrobia bacterium]|nr:TatD family hydrolase [Verrucomicrobiota bacterium]MDA1066794.1 TatD family hydrolase [Verrucomicrobiota bacterium]